MKEECPVFFGTHGHGVLRLTIEQLVGKALADDTAEMGANQGSIRPAEQRARGTIGFGNCPRVVENDDWSIAAFEQRLIALLGGPFSVCSCASGCARHLFRLDPLSNKNCHHVEDHNLYKNHYELPGAVVGLSLIHI